jgi:hypothetical protein
MDPNASFLLDPNQQYTNMDPEPDIGYVLKLTILVEGSLPFFFQVGPLFQPGAAEAHSEVWMFTPGPGASCWSPRPHTVAMEVTLEP